MSENRSSSPLQGVSRRTALAVIGGSALFIAAGHVSGRVTDAAGHGDGHGASTPAPGSTHNVEPAGRTVPGSDARLTVFPVTTTRAAVLASGITAPTAEVTTASGTSLASAQVHSGTALLTFAVPAGASASYVLGNGKHRQNFTVSTKPADFADSLWRVCNKAIELPSSYVPAGLTTSSGYPMRTETTSAYEAMADAARSAGVTLGITSAYRSYADQASTFSSWSETLGQQDAEHESAKAGHSEHQLGLAIDVRQASGVCTLNTCFGSTTAGEWVAANAHRFGFIVRYEQGRQNVTGYDYEPWHLRYVGTELAADYQARGFHCLETYFGLPAAPDYT